MKPSTSQARVNTTGPAAAPSAMPGPSRRGTAGTCFRSCCTSIIGSTSSDSLTLLGVCATIPLTLLGMQASLWEVEENGEVEPRGRAAARPDQGPFGRGGAGAGQRGRAGGPVDAGAGRP